MRLKVTEDRWLCLIGHISFRVVTIRDVIQLPYNKVSVFEIRHRLLNQPNSFRACERHAICCYRHHHFITWTARLLPASVAAATLQLTVPSLHPITDRWQWHSNRHEMVNWRHRQFLATVVPWPCNLSRRLWHVLGSSSSCYGACNKCPTMFRGTDINAQSHQRDWLKLFCRWVTGFW